jgi:flagellar hook assembly protein FlgD
LPSSFNQASTPISWIQYEPAEIKEFTTPLAIDSGSIPKEFTVTVSNVPNPFNASTEIHLTLSTDEKISLSIYSINGQRIKNLSSMYLKAGEHLIHWDGRNDYGKKVSSGVYLVGVTVKNKMVSHRMLLLK